MLNRKISRGVSKVQVGAMLAMAVLGVTHLVPRAQAAQIQLNDTNLTLTDPNAWLGGVAPGTGDIAVLSNLLQGTTNSSFTWAVGAGVANNWSGIRVINPGNNILVNDTANILTLGTSGIDMSASTVNLEWNTNVVLSGSQTWTVAAGRSLTFDRNVTLNSAANSVLTIAGLGSVTLAGVTNTTGTLGLTKVGMGVLTINAVSPFATNGAQTTIGTVTNSAGGGILRLDFSGANAPTSNMLWHFTEFNSSLAVLEVVGNADHAVSQNFFRTTFGWGLTTITSTSSGAGVALDIGVIAAKTARNGTSVRVIPNGTLSTYTTDSMPNGQVQATNAAGANAGAYMTYGLDNFAGINGNVIGAATFGGNLTDTQTWGGGNTTLLDIRGNGTMSVPGAFIDALRFSGAGARTLTISSGSLTTGGLLVTPGVGANDVTVLATDPAASLRSGSNGDLVIWQNNTQGNLILNAPLNFAGGTSGQMIKNGAGTLIIATTSNALNSSLVINEGTVRAFGGFGVDAATNIVYLEGGTFQAGADMSSGTRPIVLQGPGGGVDVMPGFTMIQSATVSGSGVLFTKTGAGTLSLTYTSNTFSSDMAVNGGTILINMTSSAAVPLGTGRVNINNAGKLAIGGGVYNRTNSTYVNAGGVLANSGSITSASVLFVASSNNGDPSATIAGTGTFSNAMVMPTGSNIEPGARSTIGTVNFQNLTLQSGSLLNMTLQAVPNSSDIINILPGGTLNLASNIQVNLWDISTGDAFFYNGSYQLFSGIDVITSGKYPGGNSTLGTLTNLVAANLNTSGGALAVFSIQDLTGTGNGSSIWVTITGALTVTNWQGPGTNWTDAANWSAGVPGTLAGDAANITGNVAPGVIDLGTSSQHLGKMGLDAGTWSANHWTLTASTGKLFLDNGTRVASITVTNGANVISAPVAIVSPTTISVNSTAGSLTISGIINATNPAATVTIFGAGPAPAGISSPVILTAINTISAPGIIDATGTLQLGDGATAGYWGSGTLTVSGTLAVKRPAGAFNFTDVAAAILGTGTLTQAGAGSTMTWNNTRNTGTFVGTLNVIGGTVKVGAGSVWTVGGVATGSSGTFDLNGTSVTVSGMSNAGVITNSSPTAVSLNINNVAGVTLGGTLTNGAGALSIYKTGGGALTLNGTGSYTGTFYVGAGVVNVNASSALPAGTQLIGNVTGGIILGNGVNLAADVLLFPSTATSYAWELPNNGTVSANATFSGTMYESGTGSQFRARVIGGGTATITGVWTGTADGYVNGSVIILSQGNMVFSGPGAQLRAGSISGPSGLVGEQLILGRAEVAGASPNLNVTLLNGAQIVNTSDPASMAASNGGDFLGAAAGSGLTLGATGGTNAVNTLTVDHASIQLGLLNLELDGQATASNLNLTGGTIVAGSYTKTNTAALTTFTINGGILQATQSTAAFIGSAGTTSNLAMVLGTGGAFIDTTSTAYSLGISSPFRANTASADGGLTVLGTGSVTLNATGSTYNGATTVNTGTLYAGADNVLAPNSVLKINNTGVVNGGGFAETIAGVDDTASATKGKAINFNTVTINAASPNIYTFAGTLTAANLAIIGSGTQILTGAANWTGNTNIGGSGLAGGKLIVGSAGTNGLTFTAAGSLTIGAGESSLDWIKGTAGSAIFTAGSMGTRTAGGVGLLNTPDGGSIRIASGSGFIDQGTFINGADYAYIDAGAGGSIRAPVYGSADAGFTAGANTLTSGNHILITASDTIASSGMSFNTLKISGGSGALNLNGNPITLASAGILKTGGGTGSIGGGSITMGASGGTAAGEFVVRVEAAGDALNLDAAILDSGGTPLLKSGAGILRLGGANTFSGTTNILNGSLVLTHAQALQSSVLVYGQNSGWLSFSGISAATLGGLVNTAANYRDILLANDTGGALALTINYNDVSATETLNNHFTGGGSLTKDGSGRIDLVSSSSFTGGVVLLGGTLSANGASLANGSTVSALGTGPLTLMGGVFRVSVSGDHSVALANAIIAPAGGDAQFNLSGTTAVTFSGNISGSGTLTRVGGSGVLFVAGTNNSAFHGTFVNGNGSNAVGDVSLATLGALGATDSTWILNSANAMIVNASASAAITLNISGTVSGSSLAINNVNTGSVITTTLNLGNSNLPATFMGNITQGGNGTNSNTVTLIKQGASQLQLGGTSSNYASLTIAGGTLSFTADAALGAGATISMFTNTSLQYTGAGGSSTKTLNLAGNATLDASGASGAVNFSSTATVSYSSAASPIALTLTGTNTAQNVLAARIGNNGTTGSPGVVSLLKTGTGNWALTNTANTFTGGTTVSNGRLYLANATGNAVGTGLVSVNSGGTLGGTGYTTANVTVNSGGALTGGTVATNLGTLNFGGVLTLNAGAILNFDMSLPGQANDLINFFGSGSVTLPAAGTVAVNLFNTNITTPYYYNGTYNLFTNLPTANQTYVSANLGKLTIANENQGGSFVLSVSGSSLRLTVTGAWSTSTWNVNSGGTWTTDANWLGGAPNGSGHLATFGSVITAPATVIMNGAKTLSTLTFNNTNSYTISGSPSDTLTFVAGTASGALVTVTAGSHVVSAPIVIGAPLTISAASNTVLTLGNVSGAGSLALTGSGSLVLSGNASHGGGTSIASTSQLFVGDGTNGTLGGIIDVQGRLLVNHNDTYTLAAGNLVQNSTGGTITNVGLGTLLLQGSLAPFATASSYLIPGSIVVSAGTVMFDTDYTTNGTGNTNLTVNAGGTFDLSGHAEQIRTLTHNAGGTLTNSGTSSGTLFLSGTSAGASAGVITGNLKLVKDGAGLLTISGGTVSNTSMVIATGQVTFTNVSSSALSGQIIVAHTDNTADLILGAGVNVSTPALISSLNFSPHANVEFLATANNALATFSGNVDMDRAAPGQSGGDFSQQLRIGNQNASGTLTYAGTITTTFSSGAYPQGDSSYMGVSRGNVNLGGSGLINITDPGYPFFIGTGPDSVTSTVNFTMLGDSRLLTSMPDDPANPQGSVSDSFSTTALKLGNTGGAATTSVHTVTGNAFVRVGMNGASAYDLQPTGVAGANSTLNLNGGSIQLGHFTVSSAAISFGGTSVLNGPQANVVFNGGTVMAGLANNDLTPGPAGPYNLRMAIGAGGMTLDLDGKPGVAWTRPMASANSGATFAGRDGGLTYVSRSAPGTITLANKHLYAGPTGIGPGATVQVDTAGSYYMGNPVANAPVNFSGGTLALTGNLTLAQANYSASMLHQYSFNDSNYPLLDTVVSNQFGYNPYNNGTPNANATVSGGMLSMTGLASSGSSSLLQVSDIGGTYTNYTTSGVSFVVWYTPATQGANAKLFSIGANSSLGPQTTANGTSYIMLDAQYSGSVTRGQFSLNGTGSEIAAAIASPATGVQHMAVLTIDAGQGDMSLYMDGVLAQTTPLTTVNGGTVLQNLMNGAGIMLGGSQYSANPSFNGSFNEFRVYNDVLNSAYIAQSFAAGPDTVLNNIAVYRDLTVTRGSVSAINLAGNILSVGGNISNTGTLSAPGTLTLLNGGSLVLTGSSTANLVAPGGVRLLVGTGGTGGELKGGSVTSSEEIVINNSGTSTLGAAITGGTVTLAGSGTTTVSSASLPRVNFNNGSLVVAGGVTIAGGLNIGAGTGSLGFNVGFHPSVLNINGGYTNSHAGNWTLLAPFLGLGFDVGTYTVITGAGVSLAGQFAAPANANGFNYTLDASTVGSLALIVGIAPGTPTTLYWTGATDTNWASNNWSSVSATGSLFGSGPQGPTSVIFNNAIPAVANLTVAGIIHDLSFTGAGGATIGGTNAPASLTIIGAGITVGAASGAVTINNAGGLNLINNETFLNNGTSGLTIDTPITGQSLTLAGAGVTTLSAANTFATGVNITGTVQLGNSGALGSGVPVTLNGTLDLNGIPLSLSDASPLAGAGTITSSAGAIPLTITPTSVFTFTGDIGGGAGTIFLAINPTNVYTFPGNIGGGAGTISLTKGGSGTLVLTGANTYAGPTTVNSGRLIVGNATALPANTGLTLGATGVLDLNGNNASVSSLTSAAGGMITNSAAGTSANLRYNSTVASYLTPTLLLADGAGTLSLTLSTGAGTLGLLTPNSFSGGVTLLDGALRLNTPQSGGVNASLGTGPLTLTGGLLLGHSLATPYQIANDLILNGNASLNTTSGSGAAVTFSGNISGSGTLTRNGGNGLVTITGTDNSSFHGTLIWSNAAGNVGNLTFASLGALPATDASFFLNSTNTVTINTSSIATIGFATLSGIYATGVLTVVSSAPATTTLQLGSSGINSTFLGSITSNANNTMTLVKVGTGTLTLGGTNVYSDTTISGGALQIGSASTTGSLGSAAVLDNASLIFNRSNAATVSNTISGSGNLTQAGTNILTLNATNSYAGGTNFNAGTLSLGSTSAIGTAGTLAFNGGVLQFTTINTTDYSARFSTAAGQQFKFDTNGQTVTAGTGLATDAAGSLTKIGTGTLILTAANSYGATTVSAGELRLNGAASLGSGNVANAGVLTFNGTGTPVAGNISGAGTINQFAGTTVLTGTNTMSGPVNITGGALQVGNGGATGALGTSNVANAATLTLNRTGTLAVSGTVTGSGTLNNTGGGTATLANYQGTGAANVAAGTLAFGTTAGTRHTPAVLVQASAATVASGATLDLTNHDLLIHGGSAATVESLIGSSYFFGLWNKPGITSSSAQSNPITTLGIMSGADYNTYSPTPGVFDGTPVLNTDIVVKYTYSGDINLDGLVNDDDFGLFSGAYFFTGVGNYALGDLNFDGLVNDDDFGVFSGNYFFTPPSPLGGLGDTSLASASASGGGSAPVPEPASLVLLGLGATALLSRRKNRRWN